MANDFIIKNGLILNESNSITGITSGDTILEYNENTLVSEYSILYNLDKLDDKYLSLSGGTLTGHLTLPTLSATTISAVTYYGDGSNLTGISGGSPGGVTGNIQFNFGGSFAGSNDLFWDFSNERLGIQTNTPSANLEIATSERDDSFKSRTDFSGSTGFSGGLNPNIFEWYQTYEDASTSISITGLQTIVESDDDANNVTTLIGNQIELYTPGSDNVRALDINIYGGGMGYGIYIENVSNGTNSNYAIYTNDGLIRIGELGTGTTINNLGIDSDGVIVVGESGSDTLSGLSCFFKCNN